MKKGIISFIFIISLLISACSNQLSNLSSYGNTTNKKSISTHTKTSNSESIPKLSAMEQVLVGSWHAGPYVGSGYNERYIFYPNKDFLYIISQYDEKSDIISKLGKWEVKGGKLYLHVDKKIDRNKNAIAQKEEAVIKLGRLEDESSNNSPYSKKIRIGEQYFWKFSSETEYFLDLDDYKEKKDTSAINTNFLMNFENKDIFSLNWDNSMGVKESNGDVDIDNNGKKEEVILGRGEPNGMKALVIFGDEGTNLFYVDSIKLEDAFDKFGELKDGYQVQLSFCDLDNDNIKEAILCVGDKKTALGIGVYKYEKGKFFQAGYVEGQEKAMVSKEGIIEVPYGTNGLFASYKLIDGKLVLVDQD